MNKYDRLVQLISEWRLDSLRWIREVLGVEPTQQQIDIIKHFMLHRFIAVRSGNKVGKTSVSAWLLLWFMCCFKDARVPCTSPSESQLKKGIWQEVGKWYRELPDFFRDQFEYGAEALTHKGRGTSWQAYVKTATKENPEVLSGAHSDNIFVIMDEGSGIDTLIINNILPLLGSPNAYSIILGNPLRTSGFFHGLFNGKPSIFKKLLKYSAEDSPLMPKETLKAWELAYGGRDSDYYKIHALGDFPDSDSDQLIPLTIIDNAIKNNVSYDEYKGSKLIWGVDVGLDHDASTILKRQGRKLFQAENFYKIGSSVKLAGRIKEAYYKADPKPSTINVDEIGIGRGTLDILQAWELPVRGINVGTTPWVKGRFVNLKAELWYMLRDWLLQEKPDIPNDPDLITDLVTTRYLTNPSGKLKIESKDQVKRRIGRSTDRGDGLILTFTKEYDSEVITSGD